MNERGIYKNKSTKVLYLLICLSFLIIIGSIFFYFINSILGIIVMFAGIIHLNMCIRVLTTRKINKKMQQGYHTTLIKYHFNGVDAVEQKTLSLGFKKDELDPSFIEYYRLTGVNYQKITIIKDLYRYQVYCKLIEDEVIMEELNKNPNYVKPKQKPILSKAKKMINFIFVEDSEISRQLSLKMSFSMENVCFAYFNYNEQNEAYFLSYKDVDDKIKEEYQELINLFDLKEES